MASFGHGVRTVRATAVMLLSGILLAGCATPSREAFAADDYPHMIRALQDVLENNHLGQTGNWHNPQTGNRGTITATRTYETSAGRPCRDYQETVTAHGVTRFRYGTGCRRADGVWEVVDITAFSRWSGRDGGHYDPYYGHRHYPYYGYWPYSTHFSFGYYRYSHPGHGYYLRHRGHYFPHRGYRHHRFDKRPYKRLHQQPGVPHIREGVHRPRHDQWFRDRFQRPGKDRRPESWRGRKNQVPHRHDQDWQFRRGRKSPRIRGGAIHTKPRTELLPTKANRKGRFEPDRPGKRHRLVAPRKSMPAHHVPALVRRAIVEGAVR